MLLLKAWPIYNKARARPVRTTRGDAENSGPNSGTERRRTSFPIASWPGTVIPRSLLTANIRLKRNSRYLTQAMPPDTIFVTLTVCFVDHWIVRHATSARERIGIRYALLAVTRGSGKRCSCFLFFSYSFRFWLASLLSLSLFLSLFLSFGFPPYTSTTRTPRYAHALTVRRQMHPTMYFCCCAVYIRDAHAAGQGRLLSLRRGKAFLFFETKKILRNNENLYNFKDFIRNNFVIKNFSVIYYSLMTSCNTYVHVACFFLYLLC